MTFEDRAHQAAHGLHRAVGPILPPPIPGAGVIAPAGRVFQFANLAQVAAALVVVVLAAGYFSTGGFFAPFFGEALAPFHSSETTSTTEGDLIVVPEGVESSSTTAPTSTVKENSPATTDAPVVHEVLILSPEDGSATESGSVVVTGEATPGLHVVVNGYVAGRDDEGGWTIALELEEGWNTIVAKGFVGDVRTVSNSIDVYHEPPVTTTTTKPKPPPAEYSLHIISPSDGGAVDGTSLLVEGESTPGLSVYVNGKAVEWIDSSHWKVTVPISPGWNAITAKGYQGDTKVAYHSIEVLNGEAQVVAITGPGDGTTVLDGSSVQVSGTATAGLTVLVNGLSVDWLDSTTWKVNVPLAAGWNTIAAKGYQGDTKVAIDTIKVHLGEIVIVPFTVNQVYGSCAENPPYETFHGTATPNGRVWVQSPYGEKSVYADGEGNFEVTIHFEGVPSGKTFEISVKDYDKHEYKYFSFTYTG